MILESYKIMMDGLSAYLGDGYELILHSLEDLEHSVIKIINGHYTGRTEGAPITDLALTMLDQLKQDENLEARPYFNKKYGSVLKSVTIPVIGEQKRIIGLFCINFHMELAFSTFISGFISDQPSWDHSPENFSKNADSLILSALNEAKDQIYADAAISSSNKNKEIIRSLQQKGIFNMKDAVSTIAENLNISKNTVYLHLRNIEKY